jgi:hypothetical protein
MKNSLLKDMFFSFKVIEGDLSRKNCLGWNVTFFIKSKQLIVVLYHYLLDTSL